MKLKKQFGSRVYELRTRAGLTQEQLASMSGVSNDTISRIERGSRSPSFEVLERLSSAFNIEVRELFNFSGRDFMEKGFHLELIDLLNYLGDKTPGEIALINRMARLMLEKSK